MVNFGHSFLVSQDLAERIFNFKHWSIRNISIYWSFTSVENRSGVGFDGALVIDHYKALFWGILSLRFGKCNKKTRACLLHTAGITRLPVWSHSLEFDFKSYLPKQCKFFSENWFMYIMFTSLDMQMVEKSLIEILRYLINTSLYASYHKFMIQLDFLINQDLSPYWSVPKHSIINIFMRLRVLYYEIWRCCGVVVHVTCMTVTVWSHIAKICMAIKSHRAHWWIGCSQNIINFDFMNFHSLHDSKPLFSAQGW